MRPQYLFSCSCGKKIPLEIAAAGQEIRCECGAVHDALTMREIRALPQRIPEEVAAPKARKWGVKQSLRLVGSLIVIFGLGATSFVFWNRPVPTDALTPNENEAYVMSLENFDGLTVSGSWQLWQFLQEGVPPTPTWQERWDRLVRRYRTLLAVSIATALIGAGFLVCATFVRDPRQRRVRPRPQETRPTP